VRDVEAEIELAAAAPVTPEAAAAGAEPVAAQGEEDLIHDFLRRSPVAGEAQREPIDS
jgi:hypothetical protein